MYIQKFLFNQEYLEIAAKLSEILATLEDLETMLKHTLAGLKHTNRGDYFQMHTKPLSTKGLVHNHMICKHTIGTGMALTIFWSAKAERAVF